MGKGVSVDRPVFFLGMLGFAVASKGPKDQAPTGMAFVL